MPDPPQRLSGGKLDLLIGVRQSVNQVGYCINTARFQGVTRRAPHIIITVGQKWPKSFEKLITVGLKLLQGDDCRDPHLWILVPKGAMQDGFASATTLAQQPYH